MPTREVESTYEEEPEEAAATALTALSLGPKDDEGSEDGVDNSFEIPQRFTKSGRKRAVPFPLKLMKVLSDKAFADIITWTPSGKSFVIIKPKAFVSDILPDHFKSAKYSSFTRKLHRWGFMRHYRGEESGAFYHKDFQKDRLDLVESMSCHKAEPTKAPVLKKAAPKKPARAVASIPETPLQQAPPVVARQAPTASDLVAQLQNVSIKPSQMVASHIDAAIEAEVTRRLKERLQQATISRMFMAQQLNTPVIPLALRAQLMQMQEKKLASMMPFSNMPLKSDGLGELPRTNIQGAKTA